jgi:glycosyltransferase involved in cell wall biosynthesis
MPPEDHSESETAPAPTTVLWPGADGEHPGEAIKKALTEAPDVDILLVADVAAAALAPPLQALLASDDELFAITALTGERLGGLEPGPAPAEDPSDPPAHDRARPGPLARVLVPSSACTLLRRSALELIGGPDTGFSHPDAVLLDLAGRAARHGMSCGLAVDLAPVADAPGACPPNELREAARRYSWLGEALADETALDRGPLRAALVRRRAELHPMSVTVDARTLTSGAGGTQTYVAGLVLALARAGSVRVRAVMADDAPADVADAFAAAGVEQIGYAAALAGAPRTDLVHRPQQVFTPDDLRLLELLGERIVISQLDLIAYRDPSYHASADTWRALRRTTRLALSAADRVLFLSEHARRDALAEELVPGARAGVAGIGVAAPPSDAPRRRPPRLPADRALLVMLGADYAHKNRPFAIRLFGELRRAHGFDGVLVLAGSHVPYGSTADEEARLLAEDLELSASVVDLGPVDEPEKAWLALHATAYLFPSSYEGFGLVPLEAAAAGTPCLYAASSSLRELIDPEAATIVSWDVARSAARGAALLRPGPERDRHLELLGGALERYRWDVVVADVLAAYRTALASSYRAGAARAFAELQREEYIVTLDASLRGLQERVSHGLPLIDANGGLLDRDQRQGLMRLAARPAMSAPLLALLGALGGADRHRRRSDHNEGDDA